MFILEVIVEVPNSLRVGDAMRGLTFTGGDFQRQGKLDTFRFEGDQATLTEAQRRLDEKGFAICALHEITEED